MSATRDPRPASLPAQRRAGRPLAPALESVQSGPGPAAHPPTHTPQRAPRGSVRRERGSVPGLPRTTTPRGVTRGNRVRTAAACTKGRRRNLDSCLRYLTLRKGGRLSLPSCPPPSVGPNTPAAKLPAAGNGAPGCRTGLNFNYVEQTEGWRGTGGDEKGVRGPQPLRGGAGSPSPEPGERRGAGGTPGPGESVGRPGEGSGGPSLGPGRGQQEGQQRPSASGRPRRSRGLQPGRGRVGAGGAGGESGVGRGRGAGPGQGAPLTFLPAPPPAPAASAEPPPEYM